MRKNLLACCLMLPLGLTLSSPGARANESIHGPHRNDPAAGIPKHAYSPFEEIEKRDHPGQKPTTVPGQLLIKLAPDTNALVVPSVAAPSAKSTKGAPALTTNTKLNRVLAKHGVKAVSPVFRQARKPARNARLVTPQGQTIPAPDLTQWQRALMLRLTSRQSSSS